MHPDRQAQLCERIRGKRDDLIALTQDLVRLPTVNPPGEGYTECVEYLGKRLSQRGFELDYVRAEGAIGDSNRYPRMNLVARREGTGPGKCLHFNSHIDVVEPGIGWSREPFGAQLINNRIYGRGTCDMKGGLAASIIAVEALLEVAPDFNGRIEISATADEESGGYGGVAYLAEQGYYDPDKVHHVIIPEPLNKDRVCLGHRGVWWAQLDTFGRIAHGSMPFLGDCAVRHMSAVVQRLEDKLFPALAAKTTRMPVVPDGAKQSTLNINSFHGGLSDEFDGLPSALVPDHCRMILDRRFLIEESLEEVRAELTGLLEELAAQREGFRYELKDLFSVHPTMADEGAPVVQATAAAIESVLGRQPEFVVSPGTYDQKHIDRIGKLHDCIAYGPGILDLAHQVDEYVDVDDMIDSAQVMALAATRLLDVH